MPSIATASGGPTDPADPTPTIGSYRWPIFKKLVREISETQSICVHSTRRKTSRRQGDFAEFERALLKERQREGIAIAKKAGVYKGRKRALTPERAIELRARVKAGGTKAAVARAFGISRETLYTYL